MVVGSWTKISHLSSHKEAIIPSIIIFNSFRVDEEESINNNKIKTAQQKCYLELSVTLAVAVY